MGQDFNRCQNQDGTRDGIFGLNFKALIIKIAPQAITDMIKWLEKEKISKNNQQVKKNQIQILELKKYSN